jgi:phosphonatase-like hydrolase
MVQNGTADNEGLAMHTINLVVFDMAGTTVEDRGQVSAAFTGALDELGITLTGETLQPWRGASKREVLRAFVEQRFGPEDSGNALRVEQAYARFCEDLERRYRDEGVHPVPGAEATFAWLRERGVRVALTTGFYRTVTDLILQALGWQHDVVDASVCSDEVPQGRPAPYLIFRAMEATGATDVGRVVKVGDTALDLQAGANAGVRGIVGVLSGSQTVERLGRVTHTHLIPSVAELPVLLDRAFG